MKTNQIGITPLSDKKLQNTNGGIWQFFLGYAVSIAGEIINNPSAHRDAFLGGWNYEPQPQC